MEKQLKDFTNGNTYIVEFNYDDDKPGLARGQCQVIANSEEEACKKAKKYYEKQGITGLYDFRVNPSGTKYTNDDIVENKSRFAKLTKLINEMVGDDTQTEDDSIIKRGKTQKGFPWTKTKIDEVSVDVLGVTLKYNIVKFHVDMPEDEKENFDMDRVEYQLVDQNVCDQLEKTITNLIYAKLGDNVANGSGRYISIPLEGYIK